MNRKKSWLVLIGSGLPFLVLVFMPWRAVYAFNSNLPPPWLARSTPPNLKHIPAGGSSTKSKTKSNPNSNDKKVNDSSSNSGSNAKDDSEILDSTSTSSSATSSATSHTKVGGKDLKDEDENQSTYGAVARVAATATMIPYMRVNGAATTHSVSTAITAATRDVLSKKGSRSPMESMEPHMLSLLHMCRFSNIPEVLFLHVMGTLAVTRGVINGPAQPLLSTLLAPSMVLVCLAICITSCSSSLIHNYYDTRYDTRTGHLGGLFSNQMTLSVPAPLMKRSLIYVYSILLTVMAFLPGKLARMSIVSSLLLTFWYTQHLKPRTWIKNVSLAGVQALHPFTSAAAACYTLGLSVSSISNVWRMSAVLFMSVMGRGIWADVLNEERDQKLNRRTIPVVYGKRMAGKVVLGLSVTMAFMAVIGPFMSFIWTGNSTWRQIMLSLLGSTMVVKNAVDIVKEGGMNLNLVKKALEESKFAMSLIMASFI